MPEQVAPNGLTIYPPDEDETEFTVSGDLRSSEGQGMTGDGSYPYEDAAKAHFAGRTDISFDCEFSGFFAYATTRKAAEETVAFLSPSDVPSLDAGATPQ